MVCILRVRFRNRTIFYVFLCQFFYRFVYFKDRKSFDGLFHFAFQSLVGCSFYLCDSKFRYVSIIDSNLREKLLS